MKLLGRLLRLVILGVAVAALREQLTPLLTRAEIDRFFTRAERVLAARTFPGFLPGRHHNVPWGFI